MRLVLAKTLSCAMAGCLAMGVGAPRAAAATLPSGFQETIVASGLATPTAMAVAPDGRIFVCQQGGQLRVIKNGALLTTPFLTVTVDRRASVACSAWRSIRASRTNGFVYVYYTYRRHSPAHNRVSRFTASGDVAVAGSERILLELNALSSASQPQRRRDSLPPGADGKLYIAVGDNANSRELPDAEQPARQDPPHQCGRHHSNRQPVLLDGHGREPRHLGARPPQPVHVRLPAHERPHDHQRRRPEHVGGDQRGPRRRELRLADDGGSDDRSEVRVAALRVPAQRGHPTGCAITGGAFYNPLTQQFPSDYTGDYFFADYCGGWIYRIDVSGQPLRW